MPKISVIIPIYKTEAYLEKCLESVLAQTFKDFDIFCVDDCSPDNSADIVEAFANRDSRVQLLRHERNLGLGGARNTAIKASSADFLASVDSDDRMKPKMLETLYSATEGETADVVVCGFDRVSETGQVVSQQKPYPGVLYNIDNNIDIFRVTNPAFWNKLWRKSLYTDNNIFFPNYVYYQDSATTPRILAKSEKIKLIPDCLYEYLVRTDSATFTYSPKHIVDYFTVFQVLKDFLLKEKLYDRYQYQFESIISHMLKYHAGNVDSSSMPDDEKKVYVRHLALLKWAFLQKDDELRPQNVAKLTELLGKEPDRERAITSMLLGGVTKPAAQEQALLNPDNADTSLTDDSQSDSHPGVPLGAKAKTISGLSILVKTFQRPEMTKRFLEAAGDYQRLNNVVFDEIIVGDDSSDEICRENQETIKDISKRYGDLNIIHDIYEFNVGLSEARNRMVARASGDYVLLCDDDFILDPECDLQKALDLARFKKVDILGGWLKNNYDLKTGNYSYWASVGRMIDLPDELVLFLNEQECPDYEETDFLLNFYIARREALMDVKWDPELKIEEHYDFFYRFYNTDYKAALTNKLFVRHTNEKPHNSKEYNAYRFKKETWEPALFKSIEKLGKKRRTVNRWRKDHFFRWQTDLAERKDKQVRVDLPEPILEQQAQVKRLTPKYDNLFFGYFDIQAVSHDGRYHLYQTAPVMDRVTAPGDVAEIGLIDTKNGNRREILATTNAWCHQQGSQLQFRRKQNSTIIFNYFDETQNSFGSKSINIVTKEEQIHPLPIAALSPDGETAVSLNFSRLYDYRPGYGYANIADPFGREIAPERDGLFSFNLKTGSVKQILSYRDLYQRFIKSHFPLHENSKVLINHVAYNTDGTKLVILFRVFSKQAPFPTFTIVCDADGGNVKKAFGFTSHYHWKDKKTLLLSGANVLNKKHAKKISLYELNTETGEYAEVDDNFFKGDGHCTYSPDRSLILYDSYSSTAFPYRKLQVYDIAQRQGVDVGYFYSPPALHGDNTDTRCDLHPRWTPDGRQITFDSMHEGWRGIYSIDVEDVKQALARGFHTMSEANLRTWYTATQAKKLGKSTTAPQAGATPPPQAEQLTPAVMKAKRIIAPIKRFYGKNLTTPVLGPMLKACKPVYYAIAVPVYRTLNRK